MPPGAQARPAVRQASAAPADAARGRRRRLLPLLFGSLVAAVAIEWLGMLFLWPEEGAGHAARMVEREVGYLNRDFLEAEVVASPAATIVAAADFAWHWGFERTGVAGAVRWLGRETAVGGFAAAALLTVQLFLLRCVVLLFSLPVFAVFVVVGLATGLSLRDVRRWSAGREFGGAFHVVRRWPGRVLWVGCFAYLSLPFAIHPTVVVLPSALLLGVVCAAASALFKKYA